MTARSDVISPTLASMAGQTGWGMRLLQLLVLTVTVVGANGQAPAPQASLGGICTAFPSKVMALLVADAGAASGVGEGTFFGQNLQGSNSLGQSVYCDSFETGLMMGQPTILVGTGIGPTKAALCVSELLQCGSQISEIIFMGTAGCSPQVGGVLDTQRGCEEANPSPDVVRLGDYCVSPTAINWACKLASWEEQCGASPNICSYPIEDDGPTESDLFGNCVFTNHTAASTLLSDEIMAAVESAPANAYAARPASVAAYEQAYWAITANGTGMEYDLNLAAPPMAFNHTMCAHADAQFYFSGAPWEMVARNYTAQAINLAHDGSVTQSDVMVANAMESVGFLQALELYNAAVRPDEAIPATIVRACSDILVPPVAETAAGWSDADVELEAPFSDGYAFAIASGSTAVMSMVQARCQAANGMSSSMCTMPTLTVPVAAAG